MWEACYVSHILLISKNLMKEKIMSQGTSVALVSFNYELLDEQKRNVVQTWTDEIRKLVHRTAQDVVDIGMKLVEVKKVLPHGAFGIWLREEFDWSESAAVKMMQVANRFKNVNVTDLEIDQSALYVLAAPSTPEPAREKAIQAAQSGVVSNAKAKEIVDKHKAEAKIRKKQSKSSN